MLKIKGRVSHFLKCVSGLVIFGFGSRTLLLGDIWSYDPKCATYNQLLLKENIRPDCAVSAGVSGEHNLILYGGENHGLKLMFNFESDK